MSDNRVLIPAFLLLFLMVESKPMIMLSSNDSDNDDLCWRRRSGGGCNKHWIGWRIGGVVDQSSRVGKEQKLAMKMAVRDFHRRSNTKHLALYLRDSNGNSTRAASIAIDLIDRQKAGVVIGTMTLQQAALISDIADTITKGIPIISITPIPISSPLSPPQPQLPSFIQMSHNITAHMQCIAAVVGQFRWRKVTAIYERSNSFEADYGLVTRLSDSLQAAGAVVENHSVFPPVASLSDPKALVEEELNKLKAKSGRLFIILRASVEFAVILFDQANQMGFMEKGCVWIVSDDIASLLDSTDQSSISNMQGVIGFKTSFSENSTPYNDFRRSFRREYRSEYPDDEEHSNPSLFALRAYDAVWAAANAMQTAWAKKNKNDSKSPVILDNILSSSFQGLSGNVSFENGQLSESPTFTIVNVVGKSYREVATWSIGSGLSEKIDEPGWIYWPGGEIKLPRGWAFANQVTPLRIGVPAKGAFNNFVNVRRDGDKNKTYVTGFSIGVFEAAVKRLPYQLSYEFVPYYGSYDEMVEQVYSKSLDAAVGDTEIMADRWKYADFSHPYMESGLVMVVTVKPDVTQERFMFLKAFKMNMWIMMAVMTVSTGFVVWLYEYVDGNAEFEDDDKAFLTQIASMLWFAFTVLSFAHRETIRSNLSRFALAIWVFVIVIVHACFTAVLTSMLTVPMLQPSVVDIDYLLSTNAAVGCNGNSFIVRYLVNVLHFKPENIKRIDSITDYPEILRRGEIAAAFFVAPHARVFLAQYCQGFTTTGRSFKLGGFGFVFPKGSPLVNDVSEAILKVTESGEMDQLEKDMLSFPNCSAPNLISSGGGGITTATTTDDLSLGLQPFSGLFIISGTISSALFFISVARLLMVKHHALKQQVNSRVHVYKWASFLLSPSYNRFGSSFFARSTNVPANNNNNRMDVNPGDRVII